MTNTYKLNLHLFDGEGGDGATSGEATAETTADAEQTMGENTVDATQTNQDNAPEDRETAFKAFIENNKDLYDKSVSKTVEKAVKGRLKGAKATEDRLKQAEAFINKASIKYGIDANNLEGLTEAFENDNAYWEERAMNEGLTVEQAKHIAELEARDAEVRSQREAEEKERSLQAIIENWEAQAEALRLNVPDFDLEREFENPEFEKKLGEGYSVQDAYLSIHFTDIVGRVSDDARKGVVSNIQARNSRPSENGTSSRASSVTKVDINNLTRKDMEELEKRAMRGERITFT